MGAEADADAACAGPGARRGHPGTTVDHGEARGLGVFGELLELPHDVYGLALNLEDDNVGCVLLGDAKEVKEGDVVRTSGRIISVPTGPSLLGRVVNALGDTIDGKGPLDVQPEMAGATGHGEDVPRGEVRGPLHGIPYGVKDLLDTEGNILGLATS